jgi:transposase
MSWGGRTVVRTALSRAALVATNWNPIIRTCYPRLLEAGTSKKVALVAGRQKWLTILKAMVTHRTPWRANAQQA